MFAHVLVAAIVIASVPPSTSSSPGAGLSKSALRRTPARHTRNHRRHVSRMTIGTRIAAATPATVTPPPAPEFLGNLPTASTSDEKDSPGRQAALDRLAAMPSLEPKPLPASAAPAAVETQPPTHHRRALRHSSRRA